MTEDDKKSFWDMITPHRDVRSLYVGYDDEVICKWKQDEDGNWETSCGEIHVLIDGTPTDNKMSYCCYCGCKIKEVPFEQPTKKEEPSCKDCQNMTMVACQKCEDYSNFNPPKKG
jgi:hypothetical protein